MWIMRLLCRLGFHGEWTYHDKVAPPPTWPHLPTFLIKSCGRCGMAGYDMVLPKLDLQEWRP